MHSANVHLEIRRLVEAGLNDCAISRSTGIARTTVRDIRRYPNGQRKSPGGPPCPRCGGQISFPAPAVADYTELLGLYLGDGHIDRLKRTYRLRLFLDAKYPGIIADAHALLDRVFAKNRANGIPDLRMRMTVLTAHSNHLPCLFPQHGPGKKHERPIVLEPWQSDLVEVGPWPFLRGLIRSDGCCFVNRTGPYEYLSYGFGNLSDDILDLFAWACDLVGVERRVTPRQVRINRRASVGAMLEHVGRKA